MTARRQQKGKNETGHDRTASTQRTARQGPHQVAKKSTTTCEQRAVDQQARQHPPPTDPPRPSHEHVARTKIRPLHRPSRVVSAACPCRGPKTGGRRHPMSPGTDRPHHPRQTRRDDDQNYQTAADSSSSRLMKGRTTRAAPVNGMQAAGEHAQQRSSPNTRHAGTHSPHPSKNTTYQRRPRNGGSKLSLRVDHNDTHDGRRERQQEGKMGQARRWRQELRGMEARRQRWQRRQQGEGIKRQGGRQRAG